MIWPEEVAWTSESCRYTWYEEGNYVIVEYSTEAGEIWREVYQPFRTCAVPSGLPVVATTTWALTPHTMDVCGYRVENYSQGTTYIYGPNAIYLYREATSTDPVAFTYIGLSWTYVGSGRAA